jgi:DNA-binding ferritin-like protein
MNAIQRVNQFETCLDVPPFVLPTKKEANESDDIVAVLNQSIAHAIDLRWRLKHAQWTVRGGNFSNFYAMFGYFSDELEAFADMMSARVKALCGNPSWTCEDVATTSRLPSSGMGDLEKPQDLRVLIATYAIVSRYQRVAVSKARHVRDHTSTSILSDFIKLLDKQTGLLVTHLPDAWAMFSLRKYEN